MNDKIITALAGFFGAVVGAVSPPLLGYLFQKKQHKKEVLKEQLNELYRPLYEKFVIMPNHDP